MLFRSGTGLEVAGGVVAVLGSSNSTDQLMIVGGAMSLAGFIITIIGHTDLVNAGRMMKQEKKLRIVSTKDGIGLAYKF